MEVRLTDGVLCMAQLSSDRPEPTTILAVTAWRDSKYAATGVAVELAMDNNCIVIGVRFFDAAPKVNVL
jgi:hypothetical protein